MKNQNTGERLEAIENTIEDIVAKMRKVGKSFSWIASSLLLTEAEVKDAFNRYQNRLASGDRSQG